MTGQNTPTPTQPGIRFSPSFGALLAIGLQMAGAIWAFATVSADLKYAKEQIQRNTVELRQIDTASAGLRERIIRLEEKTDQGNMLLRQILIQLQDKSQTRQQ